MQKATDSLNTVTCDLCRILTLLLLAWLASACQTVPTSAPPAWSEREQVLLAQSKYSAKGRISVRHAAGAEQGNFALVVDGEIFDLGVQGPFGLGAVSVVGTPVNAVLTSARTGVVELNNLDEELVAMLGYPLPMAALSYWLLGIPQPGLSAQKMYSDDGSLLDELAQAGWRVEYPDYRLVDKWALPRKIRLFGPDVEIRLSIRRWELPDMVNQ